MSEMPEPELSNADIEALLNGRPVTGPAAPLSDLVAELKAVAAETPAVPASESLATFLPVLDLTTSPAGSTAGTSRRPTLLSALGTFAATTFGKIALGTAVAAASVGGAHVADVVEIPGLPDGEPAIVEVETSPDTTVEEAPRATVAEEELEDETDSDESPDTTVADGDGDGDGDGDKADNHGQTVSDFVHSTDLEGCERGQAISAIASANAAEHRQNPERDHNPCDKSDKDDDDESEQASGAEADEADHDDDEADHDEDEADHDEADDDDDDEDKKGKKPRRDDQGEPGNNGRGGRR